MYADFVLVTSYSIIKLSFKLLSSHTASIAYFETKKHSFMHTEAEQKKTP